MKKIIISLMFVSALFACSQNQLSLTNDQQKKYALTLQEKGLYQQAVDAFKELAEQGGLNSSECAGAYYRAADICFEDIRDYEQALGLYIKSEICGAQGDVLNKIKMKIVACLERLGKSYDAQKELDARTLPDRQQSVAGETVVAHIGKRQVTMNEVHEAMRMLPEYLQKEYSSPEKKLEFMRHYIATELLYDSALRKGFDREPAITKAAEQMKKNLMVEALLSQELEQKVNVTDTEIKLYYEAHKNEFKGAAIEQVKNQIAVAVGNEKKQQAYAELIDRLLKAEQAVIYEEYFTSNTKANP